MIHKKLEKNKNIIVANSALIMSMVVIKEVMMIAETICGCASNLEFVLNFQCVGKCNEEKIPKSKHQDNIQQKFKLTKILGSNWLYLTLKWTLCCVPLGKKSFEKVMNLSLLSINSG